MLPIVFLLLMPVAANAQDKKILFIGNSYTTYDGYNIPKKVKRLAKASGKKVTVQEHTRNGFTLQQHLENPRALHKIRKHRWDYVVLQEQSWTAVANTEKGMYPGIRTLDSLIKLQGGQTVLYTLMPKEYSQNDVFNFRNDSTIYYYTVFKDFTHAQDSLQYIHLKIAQEIGAMTAPVGLAFKHALAQRPELKLYKKDRVHHSREGAYLAACVFYLTLFHEQADDLPYTGKLEKETARFLRQVATLAVNENKTLWHKLNK